MHAGSSCCVNFESERDKNLERNLVSKVFREYTVNNDTNAFVDEAEYTIQLQRTPQLGEKAICKSIAININVNSPKTNVKISLPYRDFHEIKKLHKLELDLQLESQDYALTQVIPKRKS